MTAIKNPNNAYYEKVYQQSPIKFFLKFENSIL